MKEKITLYNVMKKKLKNLFNRMMFIAKQKPNTEDELKKKLNMEIFG